jgi:hypothetical protein
MNSHNTKPVLTSRQLPPSSSESTMRTSHSNKREHSRTWAANMTWIPKASHNSTINNSNLTDTSTPTAIGQPLSTVKSMFSVAPLSHDSRTPANSFPDALPARDHGQKDSQVGPSNPPTHPTFPAAVLSSPHLLQLPMPSDAIQTSQLRCFWRSQHRGPRQAAATNRLLQRALHQQANHTTNPQAPALLQPTPTTTGHGTLWAHTIAAIYADSELAICKPPTGTNTVPPSITHSYPALAPVADQLHQHALTTVGDLHTGQRWMTLDHFLTALLPQLQPILQGPPQPTPDRSIHPSQFWHLYHQHCPNTQTAPSLSSSRIWNPTAINMLTLGSQ